MGQKPRLSHTKPSTIAGHDIPSRALDARTVDRVTGFAFVDCDPHHYPLWRCNEAELRGLVNLCRTVEQLPWPEVLTHGGLRPKTIDRAQFPAPLQATMDGCLSPDVAKITELRAGGRARVFGYRINAVFYLLWFDHLH